MVPDYKIKEGIIKAIVPVKHVIYIISTQNDNHKTPSSF